MDLENKNILITGASSGIGQACAEMFAEKKANIYILARRKENLQKLANTLSKKYSIQATILTADITIEEEVDDALDNLPLAIDILVNNAGLALGVEKLQDGNYEDWQKMFATNVLGLLYVTHKILPSMVKNNSGHIINIGSISGHSVYPGGAVYCATKHAERALTEGLKLDLHGTNIRSTSIDPGMVETEFSIVRFNQDIEKAENVYKGMTPLSKYDVADAVIYAATRPQHVNISEIILLPVDQSSTYLVNRKGDYNG